ncbi:MAG: hypothetical protein Q4B68_05955 [Bacteroidales bacterium]|nr:hypothetical protein [Bacteroidales bacterium]
MKKYQYMIATLLVAMAGAFQAAAQVTETPYSRVGYGVLNDNATGIQRHMGGVGYAMQGGRAVNSMNPASYAVIDSLTFIWDVGLEANQVWSKEGTTKGKAFSGGLDYLNGVFRVAKNVGASFGFIPVSSVNYRFNNELDGGNESREGEGAISELYLGGAWSPVKGLSVGANFSYLFGTLEHTTAVRGVATTIYYRMMEVRDWNVHIGAQYALDLDRKNRVVLGATYSPKKSLHGNTIGTYYDATSDLKLDTAYNSSLKGKYEQPNTFGVGVSYSHGSKFFAEVDFTYQDWAKAKYTPMPGFESANTKFDNRWKVGAGLQYIPDERGNYLKRINYRLGAFYNHDYINVLGNNVRDYGLTLGFGFPALGSKTLVNLGLEWKHRVSSPVCLVKEDFLGVTFSVTFNEMWFWKNKLR